MKRSAKMKLILSPAKEMNCDALGGTRLGASPAAAKVVEATEVPEEELARVLGISEVARRKQSVHRRMEGGRSCACH